MNKNKIIMTTNNFLSELKRTRNELEKNIDKKDPAFIYLILKLKRIVREQHIRTINFAKMEMLLLDIKEIYIQAHSLNLKNQLLLKMSNYNLKFVRIINRILIN